MKPQVANGCSLCEIANTCLLGEAAWKPAVWWGQGWRRNSVLHCVLGGDLESHYLHGSYAGPGWVSLLVEANIFSST